jgi:hypothetical protein
MGWAMTAMLKYSWQKGEVKNAFLAIARAIQ